MKIFLNETVLEAGRRRMRWLFREFDNVYVNFSGGKDSTVVLHLALEVAEELGRLPLPVRFIDQEAEWGSTIEYVREVMADPRIKPIWFQVPIRLSNGTSADTPWLYCWEEGREWMRPKEPNSIHENKYGTITFADLFTAHLRYEHPNEKAVAIAGVRCEESPARRLGLTSYETYGGETWGKVEDKKRGHYVFYPLYDWSYTDIWKYIHEKGVSYCKLYDYQYQYGIGLRNMRLSSLHHETAITNLFYLQEVERETWDKLTARLGGVRTAGQLQTSFFAPKKLPPMFRDWREYRDHLLENLITDPEKREVYRKQFAGYENNYEGDALRDLWRTEVSILIVNDYHGVKLSSFVASHMHLAKNAGKRSGKVYRKGATT